MDAVGRRTVQLQQSGQLHQLRERTPLGRRIAHFKRTGAGRSFTSSAKAPRPAGICPYLHKVVKLHRLDGGWRSLTRTALYVKFPDHQGKYREFERSDPHFDRPRDEKRRRCLGFLAKFPTQRNREFLRGNRELFLRIREFSGPTRESSNSSDALFD